MNRNSRASRSTARVAQALARNARTLGRAALAAAVLAFCAIGARADVLVLKDGRRIEGTITAEGADTVKIHTSYGDLEFPKGDVASIEKGKTTAQDLADRKAAAKTAEDFYQVGVWANGKKLKAEAKHCMQKALELDPKHAGAHTFLGHVQYKGEWMTPDERDKRQAADQDAEMLAAGLVKYDGRWVTPEEKGHLENNEVLVDGKWISFAESQRRKGLEEFDGRWLPRPEALARGDIAAVEKLLSTTYTKLLTDDAILVGPQVTRELEEVADGLKVGREWFDKTFKSKPGLEIFGGRLAEFYLFTDDAQYMGSVDHFTSLTRTLPDGWSDAVRKTHGFLWWDPYPLSSARQWHRAAEDLVGHCYHHWGHLLLNRLNYDGRLLPPWFDEGVACLLEFRTHNRNAVFCKGSKSEKPVGPSTGSEPGHRGSTKAGKGATQPVAIAPFDPKAMRDGNWRAALVAGIKELPAFDQLASLQFNELESSDIAASMGIVEWLESRGPDALRAFLDVLRRTAPPSPTRVLPSSIDRERVYEEAFKAAAGMGWKEADKAWRQWIASR